MFIKKHFRFYLFSLSAIIFFRILNIQSAVSQNDSFFNENPVRIYKDSRIDTLITRIYGRTDDKPKMSGYRIQIYSGSNKKESLKAKSDFLQSYDNIPIYLDYQQPNYKIRVGDFRNRVEAQKLYNALLKEENFKAVIIVPDEIYLPEL